VDGGAVVRASSQDPSFTSSIPQNGQVPGACRRTVSHIGQPQTVVPDWNGAAEDGMGGSWEPWAQAGEHIPSTPSTTVATVAASLLAMMLEPLCS
jgi:hypothetical protein